MAEKSVAGLVPSQAALPVHLVVPKGLQSVQRQALLSLALERSPEA
ncbi:hypothetical protein LTSEHVI_4476 [Salmonella enterica subsp. enterica serovar Hvittingfoss str. A4-620]|nr:hypothetical protein LTSEHVI_4476 [Salmonella enterica subsp. enterica serovar Hvittingfoss str. A4-620]